MSVCNKMTNTKIQNCRNSAKIQYNIVEREKQTIPLTHKYMTAHIPGLLHIVEKDTDHTSNTQIYHRSHSWLVTYRRERHRLYP